MIGSRALAVASFDSGAISRATIMATTRSRQRLAALPTGPNKPSFPGRGQPPLTLRATTSPRPFQASRNWSRQDRDTARSYFAPHRAEGHPHTLLAENICRASAAVAELKQAIPPLDFVLLVAEYGSPWRLTSKFEAPPFAMHRPTKSHFPYVYTVNLLCYQQRASII